MLVKIVCQHCDGTGKVHKQTEQCQHCTDGWIAGVLFPGTESQVFLELLFETEEVDFIRNLRHIRGSTCVKCGGWGVRMYSTTATWRGGIGGRAMTRDVCDRCWGSGDDENRWPSHNKGA